VESTYNWYWLVDGLMEADYRVHLANPAAIQQYSGLKYTNDQSDARWLAHLLRLGVLPEGYIYPKAERAVRDLAVFHTLHEQIITLEKTVSASLKHTPAYGQLLTVDGIGTILAQTIVLETGDIGRFPTVGHYASYCRCVPSTKISNGKRKGQGNVKNGNKYLSWAYMEAAQFAMRYSPKVQQFYQRKQAKTSGVLARKAIAHKLARACFYIMRDLVPFAATKAFG
jgi:transposase